MNKTADKFMPVDFGDRANAGPGIGLDENWGVGVGGFLTGSQRWWGIPFALPDPATHEGRCWIAIGADPNASLAQHVTLPLPVPTRAGALVVAHCTDLESARSKIGDALATYTLIFANGQRADWLIRRRFEIAARRAASGTQGYSTVPHVEPKPVRAPGPGQDGLYGMMTEGSAQTYWLSAFENPWPDEPIVSIEMTAHHLDFVVIGGITLARDRTNPLRRSRRMAIRIELPALADETSDGDARVKPDSASAMLGDVSVGVDLGQVVRVSPASDLTPERWHAASIQGWGEPENNATPKSVYAEVYATESADLQVRKGSQSWSVPWQDVIAGAGQSADGQVRVTTVHAEQTRLRVQVVDDETGQAMPVRVNFRGPDGEYLPPHGHTADVNPNWGEDVGGDLKLGATSYAYVPGEFEINVPVGAVYAEVVRGFEYTPLRQALTITPGQTHLRLALHRWTDARSRGYYNGDVHVHFLDPATAALEAAAEDLNVTNLLAVQWGRSFTNAEHGIGTLAANSMPNHLIRVDSENRHHIMGHLFLLGLNKPIWPLSSGGPTEDELGGWDEVSLAEWCDATHAQGGLVCTQFIPTPHAEVVADIVLGKIDATEVRWFEFTQSTDATPFAMPGMAQWYRYLNCGYRLPAVGGTDKMSNTTAVGAMRTYAHLGNEPFSYEAWSRAIKAGHTYVSSGPLIELEVEGRMPGDEIALPEGGGTLMVTASAQSAQPFEFIEIVQNGVVVARGAAAADGRSARLNAQVRVTASSWLAARCYGHGKIWTRWPVAIGAHTSAVFIIVGGLRQTSAPDANYLLTLLEGGLAYLDTLAAWRDEGQRQRHRAVFLAGREALQRHHPGVLPQWHPHSHTHSHTHSHPHTHPHSHAHSHIDPHTHDH